MLSEPVDAKSGETSHCEKRSKCDNWYDGSTDWRQSESSYYHQDKILGRSTKEKGQVVVVNKDVAMSA